LTGLLLRGGFAAPGLFAGRLAGLLGICGFTGVAPWRRVASTASIVAPAGTAAGVDSGVVASSRPRVAAGFLGAGLGAALALAGRLAGAAGRLGAATGRLQG
jgi:hypothetical protein